ncbi:Hypothetical_protein [Hexamita inflata]|uniref:Hypothetical_protein n=1 Tax=Hexamita inflata TaxID=28002 RepID=A0AA86UJC2_9EUKA|nr:Hypothetical protein HINF_LOCUS29838 [Hexamita inflata]
MKSVMNISCEVNKLVKLHSQTKQVLMFVLNSNMNMYNMESVKSIHVNLGKFSFSNQLSQTSFFCNLNGIVESVQCFNYNNDSNTLDIVSQNVSQYNSANNTPQPIKVISLSQFTITKNCIDLGQNVIQQQNNGLTKLSQYRTSQDILD